MNKVFSHSYIYEFVLVNCYKRKHLMKAKNFSDWQKSVAQRVFPLALISSKGTYPPENRFFLFQCPIEKILIINMSLKSYWEIPKIGWVIANLVAAVPPKIMNKKKVKIRSKLECTSQFVHRHVFRYSPQRKLCENFDRVYLETTFWKR